jgi:hypothetical protein
LNNAQTPTSETAAGAEPDTGWDDPRVQIVYVLLISDADDIPISQHWEGWIARRSVDALAATPPAATQVPTFTESPLGKFLAKEAAELGITPAAAPTAGSDARQLPDLESLETSAADAIDLLDTSAPKGSA